MKTLWLSLFLLLSPSVARANQITPAFTQGSMNATTTTTQTVTETIDQKVYGGELKSWSGSNVSPTGGTIDPAAAQTFTIDSTLLEYLQDNPRGNLFQNLVINLCEYS